ncbi:MAG: STAS domain-containing protein [Comamonas sp.]|jgi:ABC-type transporter Mla MlaB component|uniref:STAS domain-containing protein n=1 Tax=Comamonas sp. TaxID=34028 RepID=UPI0012BE4824|nr:STAS domain-containing protein [Comamonas sp.]MDR3065665.1 STAS domain-containing protein [Comamonas sp.]MPS94231.1 STAS domain-containing protein [Comamonas sp.]
MVKEENKSGGLLSKVARFVRHPTVNWSDLENLNQESEESQYSKQALKEMLERKRQNDFVRKREFDQLRKLRQAQLSKAALSARVPLDSPTPLAASSFLQTAQSSVPGERAQTIRKIDEIEAQMAQQWWRGKQAADAATMPLQLPEEGNTMPSVFKTQPPSLGTLPLLQDVLPSDLKLPQPGGQAHPAGMPALRGETDFSPGFATTEVAAPADVHMVPPSFVRFEHDAALEDAAIVFASGDNAAAEASLKALIAERAQDAPAQLPVWLALLDMYRAAGMQARFEDAAMDFVARFGRSAPQWFVMPQQAGRLSEAPSDVGAAPIALRWQAPVQLDEAGFRALLAHKARCVGSAIMDWSTLESLARGIQKPLLDAVQRWAGEKGTLVFAGHERLLAVLSKHTPSGDRSVDQDWWHLRLAMLRLMHLQDEFELTALDYCVTYELSPPSWEDPLCAYAHEGQAQSPRAQDSRLLGPETLQPGMLWKEHKPRFALQGVIDGDALPWLAEVQEKAKLGEAVAIDCTRLVRMDFAAAGSVLNWAAQMQELGHVLQFSQLHQLLAVFFNVVGIQEHAQVVPRRD